jgi:hypothetical protein
MTLGWLTIVDCWTELYILYTILENQRLSMMNGGNRKSKLNPNEKVHSNDNAKQHSKIETAKEVSECVL